MWLELSFVSWWVDCPVLGHKHEGWGVGKQSAFLIDLWRLNMLIGLEMFHYTLPSFVAVCIARW
jgi:hypothetical protein